MELSFLLVSSEFVKLVENDGGYINDFDFK